MVSAEAIVALVEPEPGAPVHEDELVAAVKERLASYKAPKRVLFVESVGRAPNGKLDYAGCRQIALERLS